MPAELRPHVDFVCNSLVIVLGYTLKRVGLLKEEHVSGIRALTFWVCLPMMLCRVLWTAQLDSSLLLVAVISAVTQCIVVALASTCMLFADFKNQGFYMSSVLGCGLAYSYDVLLNSAHAETAMATSLLWDLGGNIWLAVVVQGIIAGLFAPPSEEEADISAKPLHRANPETTLRNRSSSDVGTSLPPNTIGVQDTLASEGVGTGGRQPGIALQTDEEQPSLPRIARMHSVSADVVKHVANGLTSRATPSRRISGLLCTVLQMPLLWGAFAGLLLCVAGVPAHPVPLRLLNTLAGAFPPLLYVLLGISLQFNLGRDFYGQVAKALLFRWSICAIMIFIVRQYPVEPATKWVMTLSFACPLPTTAIVYTDQFNHPMPRVIMTYNIAALASVMAIHTLSPIV